MPFVSFLDENSGMGEIMMQLPESMRPFSEMVEVILRGPSVFSVGEREMIGAFVSASNNCSYCYGSHAATAKRFGIDDTLFEALLDDIETAAIEEKLKPILRYVKKRLVSKIYGLKEALVVYLKCDIRQFQYI